MYHLHNSSDNCTTFMEVNDKIVKYNGLDLLVVQCQNIMEHPNIKNADPEYPDRYVQIAGRLLRYKCDRTLEDSGLVYSEVEPFEAADDNAKAELEKLIRDAGFKGPIDFGDE